MTISEISAPESDPDPRDAPVPARSGPDEPGNGPVKMAGLRLAAMVLTLVVIGLLSPWTLVVIMALVVMITLHEFGHYVMAKRAGMKVTEFFLGFGPRIWSTRRGETEYGVKAIPAGAYVRIIGMHNLEEVPPEDEDRTYRQKSFWQRIGVAVAGSTMHFLLAIGLIFVALVGIGQPAGTLNPQRQAAQWRIDDIVEGSGAQAAGLAAGDRIVSIDGKEIADWDALRSVSAPLKNQTVPLVYERDGSERSTTITLDPFYSWAVSAVPAGSAIDRAGLEVGDQVLAIDGRQTSEISDLDDVLSGLEGKQVPITYERDGEKTTTSVELDSLILLGGRGYIGVGGGDAPDERVSPAAGLVRAPAEFLDITRLSVGALGRFFSPSGISDFAGQVTSAGDDRASADAASSSASASTSSSASGSSAQLSTSGNSAQPGENRLLSIYGLVRIGSDVGQVNPGALIVLFAMINIFIGVFNLLPMLPFDGGHVVIAVYERIQERRLHQRRYFADVGRLLPFTYAVVLLMGMLFISTIYLDIANPLVTG